MISPRKPTSYFFFLTTQPTRSMSYYYLYYNKYFFKIFMLGSQLTQIVDTIMFSICHFHVVVLLQQLSSILLLLKFFFYHIDLVFLILTQFSKWFFFFAVNIDKYAYLLSGTSFVRDVIFFFRFYLLQHGQNLIDERL